ncbi:MAG: glycosyltransferase family 1 protein [Anaerolineae bacterium]
MNVQLLVRSYNHMIGLARYTVSLCQAMDEAGIAYSLAQPVQPRFVQAGHRLLEPFGFDVRTFFTTYPVAAGTLANGVLTHLTTQQMATLLWFRPRLRPAIVTVHDIVPFLVRSDESQTTFRHPLDVLFDELAMKGLHLADTLIADSHFTKQTMVSVLGCRPDKVQVVHLGVRHEIFNPRAVDAPFFQRFGLDPGLRYLLYVGSENPRKNLPRLLQAFRAIHAEFPDCRLVKIGSEQYTPQAVQLRQQVLDLGLQDAVIFVEHVSDDDLAGFYSLASLFVFPSLMEGFGLPPLEAMACGAPVVCSHAASLPEVVGDAAILVDPSDVAQIADAMRLVLTQPALAAELRARGLARAAQFTWERTARETIAVYERVVAGR